VQTTSRGRSAPSDGFAGTIPSRPRTRCRFIGLPLVTSLAIGVALMGCSGQGAHRPSAAATTTKATPQPVPATQAVPQLCGSVPGAEAFWLLGLNGHQRLEANVIGSGSTTVVFMHQTDRIGMCGFWTFATWLARSYSIRAVLVNRCDYGRSVCTEYPAGTASVVAGTQPAVQWAYAHGAKRVVLFGASVGAGDALEAAGLVPGISAVVAVSDAGNDTAVDQNIDARKDDVPTLFAVAPLDPLAPLATIQRLYSEVPGAPKKLIVLSGDANMHGFQLLTAPSPFAVSLATWILQPTS
jgi:hypothetical protein